MKLKAIFTCVVFLAVTVACSERSRNKAAYLKMRYQKLCKQFNRQIQIFRPQGLELHQRVKHNLYSIDLKVYINQKNEPRCSYDIWENATVAHRGQNHLLIKHPSVVVLPGDTVQYSITEHYLNGDPKPFDCEFQAKAERMKFMPKSISPQSCPFLRPKTVLPRERRNYTAEKTLLEEIINDLLPSCEAERLTKLLVLTADYTGAESEKALKRYVVDRLNALLPSVDWRENVENVYRSQERIVFEVKSVLMKLKILHSIRDTDLAKNIIEYEEPRNSANEHEEISDDYGDYETTTEVVDRNA